MALTDVKKANEAIWVQAIEPWDDEEHLIAPYTKEMLRQIGTDSQSKEMVSGQIVTKFDVRLFDEAYIRKIWKGWRGIPDPENPSERLPGVGIRHADGREEYPAKFTEENKTILLSSRPIEFFSWMQEAANDLAKAVSEKVAKERQNFRAESDLSAREPEAEL